MIASRSWTFGRRPGPRERRIGVASIMAGGVPRLIAMREPLAAKSVSSTVRWPLAGISFSRWRHGARPATRPLARTLRVRSSLLARTARPVPCPRCGARTRATSAVATLPLGPMSNAAGAASTSMRAAPCGGAPVLAATSSPMALSLASVMPLARRATNVATTTKVCARRRLSRLTKAWQLRVSLRAQASLLRGSCGRSCSGMHKTDRSCAKCQ
mmetsp:Transcript_27400/g.78956  ORF Transcript_27400/g.78956 Transcript_27400/m.78956 type:complete len:214 (+) Transcript_27400:962-1603(+)